MSDGGADYPKKGIEMLLSDQNLVNKIEFNSVAYGSKAKKEILNNIAKNFPVGKLIDAPNAEALAKSFMDIVPNINK